MKPLQKSIAVIGLVFAGAALLIWSASQGASDTKVTPVQVTIPGCAPAAELTALQQTAISGDARALEALKEKATGGDPCAQQTLSYVYKDPKSSNEAEALKWIEKAIEGYTAAAEKGNLEAEYQLGTYFWYEKRNLDEAMKWWNRAAEEGHPSAQYQVGSYHAFNKEFGKENRKDEGVKWLKKAASQGHVLAMFELGSYYDDSLERKPDFKEAAKWYSKAAEQNFTLAQRFLSNMYAKGDGVSQDWKIAYFWGCVAERCFENSKRHQYGLMMSYPTREQSDPLEGEGHLTAGDIQEIKRKASEWRIGRSFSP